jgi:ABC-type nitrate/sulfonate/bicarbonate transport system substrate-binding protein
VNVRATLLLALLVLPALAATCGGHSSPKDSGLAGLQGKTVGVVSLTDVSTLELRYLLHESYGLDTSRKTGTVTLTEVAPESIAGRLAAGQLDAALLPLDAAYAQALGQGAPPASHVSQEAADAAGGTVAESVLLSYRDVVDQKAEAIGELDRLLAQSVAYEDANRSSVFDAVAAALSQDQVAIRWQADRMKLPLGDLSKRAQDSIARTWRMAAAVGDIATVPDITSIVFDPGKRAPNAQAGGRVTISLALLDDPTRRAALSAIEQGIVASSKIDISITYLSARALPEAATTKLYDVVEASPLIISSNSSLPFVILSAGAQDIDGAVLFVSTKPGLK